MASIGVTWLRLPELQKCDLEVKELRSRDLLEEWEDIEDLQQY